MRMSDFCAQTRLIANDLEWLVGKECSERRDTHRRSVSERAHAAESDLGQMAPIEPVFHPAENRISALTIAALELHSVGETVGQLILIDAGMLFQDFHDGQCHFGVVGIGPRRIGKDALRDALPDFREWPKEPFTKGVADG